MFVAALLLAISAVSATAQVRIGMTPLGYALDETAHGLRPLIGTPGSAYFGPVAPLPFPIAQAAVRNGVGLVLSEEGVAHRVSGLEGDGVNLLALSPARRFWVDTSGTLALLETPEGDVRLVRNLRSDAMLGPALRAGTIAAVSFMESDSCALVAVRQDRDSMLHRLCADRLGELTWLRTLPDTSVSAMVHTRGAGLFVHDGERRQLLRLRTPIGSGTPELVHQSTGVLAGLTAAGPDEVWAAFEDNVKIVIWADGGTSFVDLPTPARQLTTLAPNRLIACTPLGVDEPLLLVDLLQDRAAFFVPVLRSSE